MTSQNTTDPNSHSAPIPINSNISRSRHRSASESSESDSVPPLSPSHSPSSSTTVPSPFSSTRIPLSPGSPSASPILTFFYGSPTSPNKGVFSRSPFETEDSPDPTQVKQQPLHARRLSTSWIPPRFNPQQQSPMSPSVDPPQDRGMGILRRLSLSTPRVGIPPPKPSITVPPNQISTITQADEGMKPRPNVTSIGRPPGHRRVSTLSPGSPKRPRAPSPMGERMLKGHYDGF